MSRDKLAYLIGNLIMFLTVAIGFPLVLESCSTCHGPCGLAEGQFEWFKECVMTRFGLLLLASVAIAITLDNELRAKAKDFLSDFLHVMSFYLSALSILALAMGPFLVGAFYDGGKYEGEGFLISLFVTTPLAFTIVWRLEKEGGGDERQ